MKSTTATKLSPHPSHPYRDSTSFAQLSLDIGTGIRVQNSADRMELVGYYLLIGYSYSCGW